MTTVTEETQVDGYSTNLMSLELQKCKLHVDDTFRMQGATLKAYSVEALQTWVIRYTWGRE